MVEKVLDWSGYKRAALTCAAEGIVMLKNDGALPLSEGCRVALFGRAQSHYYKSGTGSGGMVNVSHVTDIREGLADSAKVIIDKELVSIYDKWDSEHEEHGNMGWGREAWSMEEMPLEDTVVREASERNDVAVIVIARTAGEDRDNTAMEGSYYLAAKEKEMLRLVTLHFEKTVVVLNTGNIIDMSFVADYKPSAVLYVWQGGMVGGEAAAEVLTGKVNPSGCLTDTIAKEISDYPSDSNFGKTGLKDYYKEDIFVGYRYFETFAKDKVLYPFGSGLSYTEFSFEDLKLTASEGKFEVSLDVVNKGNVPGKKACIVYVKLPAGKVTKPKLVLAGFSKTGIIEPGASMHLTVDIPLDRIVSFDDDGRGGLGTGWIFEEGEYEFIAGGPVDDAVTAGSYFNEKSYLTEKIDPVAAPIEEFDRMTITGFEKTPVRAEKFRDLNDRIIPEEIEQTGDKGIKLADVKSGKNSMDEFIAQLSDEELSLIVRGEGMGSMKVTMGTAGAFGGIAKSIADKGVPAVCCSDGPSGMRIDSGKKAFALPNGTCLASTFNLEAVEELFEYTGLEMLSNRIDTLLGPGINIHRHPLNGRNFEYFSEDPLLTGLMAAVQVRAMERNNVTPTIKHYSCNNREKDRRQMDSVVSEKALREIYLKPFEIAVREGHARSVMSSYNRVNGMFTANNYEHNTLILREQWGFKGIVMTDWWASISKDGNATEEFSLDQHSVMARSQNDIYMVCHEVDNEFLSESDVMEELKNGTGDKITRSELQRCARNILEFAMNTPAFDRLMGNGVKVIHEDCPFSEDDIDVTVDNYYDVDNGCVIEVTDDTSEGKDLVFGVTGRIPGTYDLIATGVSDLSRIAQIPVTVFITSIPVSVMSWNGTEGKEEDRKCNFYVFPHSSRALTVRLHPGRPGVKIVRIEIKYSGPLPEKPFGED